MSDPPVSFATLRSEAVADAVSTWARTAEWAWKTGLRLWKLPLELAADEDESLGIWKTSVYFPGQASKAVRLRCSGVRDVVINRAVAVNVQLTPGTLPALRGPQRVVVTMPQRVGPGLFEVTLEDQASGTKKTYVLPFGVPRRPG